MNLTITPAPLSGTVEAPPSKSAAHRALICAALSNGTSQITNLSASQDMEATLDAIRALGAKIIREKDSVIVEGIGGHFSCLPKDEILINCRESGSTLRFLLPIVAALGLSAKFIGHGKLPNRPIGPLVELMEQNGVTFTFSDDPTLSLPLHLTGQLHHGLYLIPGDLSSQFITGLLFAAPLLPGDTEIRLTTPLASRPYVDLTIELLSLFSVRVFTTEHGFFIPGNQQYSPKNYTIEGDFSNAAFHLCAGAIGNSPITVTGLNLNSTQGDRKTISILEQFGAAVSCTKNLCKVASRLLHGIEIDAEQIPDLVPVLAVTASLTRPGEVTRITHVARLRLKESDRLSAIADCLNRIGGRVSVDEDTLTVVGVPSFTGGVVSGYNDHRIVMSMAVAASRCTEPLIIEGWEAVTKSYPDYFTDYQKLGGITHVFPLEK